MSENNSGPEKLGTQELHSSAIAHLEYVPVRYQNIVVSALKGEGGRANAIKAQCLQCVGYQDGPKAIRECPSKVCPLWPYRPYQKTNQSKEGN